MLPSHIFRFQNGWCVDITVDYLVFDLHDYFRYYWNKANLNFNFMFIFMTHLICLSLTKTTKDQTKDYWRLEKENCLCALLLDETKPAYCTFLLKFHQREAEKNITTLFLTKLASQNLQLLYLNTQWNQSFKELLQL